MRYICLDIECTGFGPDDELIEFAAIETDESGTVYDQVAFLVRPRGVVPRAIYQLTGIDADELAAAEPVATHLPTIRQWIARGLPIAGHGIDFDINFLERYGVEIPNYRLDTHPLSQTLLKGHESYSLEALTKDLNLLHGNPHRALSDVEGNVALITLLAGKLRELPDSVASLFEYALQQAGSPMAGLTARPAAAQPQQLLAAMLAAATPAGTTATEPTHTEEAQLLALQLADDTRRPLVASLPRSYSQPDTAAVLAALQPQPSGTRLLVVAGSLRHLAPLAGSAVLLAEPEKYIDIAKLWHTVDAGDNTDAAYILLKLAMEPQRLRTGLKEDYDLGSREVGVWKRLGGDASNPLFARAQAAAAQAQRVYATYTSLPWAAADSFDTVVASDAEDLLRYADDLYTLKTGWEAMDEALQEATEEQALAAGMAGTVVAAMEDAVRATLEAAGATTAEAPALAGLLGPQLERLQGMAARLPAAFVRQLGILQSIADRQGDDYITVTTAYPDGNTTLASVRLWAGEELLQLLPLDKTILLGRGLTLQGDMLPWLRRQAVRTLQPAGSLTLQTAQIDEPRITMHCPLVKNGAGSDTEPLLQQALAETAAGLRTMLVLGNAAQIGPMYEDILARLSAEGRQLPVLGQNISGSQSKMTKKLRELPDDSPLLLIVGLGLAKYLALQNVTTVDRIHYQKLPFSYFQDIVPTRRAAAYGNTFTERDLPQCAANMMENAGYARLLLRPGGAMAMWDPRLTTANYGKDLIALTADTIAFANGLPS